MFHKKFSTAADQPIRSNINDIEKKIKIKKDKKLYQDEPLSSIQNENIMNVIGISKGKGIKHNLLKVTF